VQAPRPIITKDSDALLLRSGAELSAALVEVGSIPSPLTRSALVVFEDSLQDDLKVAEVLTHIQQFREAVEGAVPMRVLHVLDKMILRLDAMPGDQPAAMFRSGFFQRRSIVPA